MSIRNLKTISSREGISAYLTKINGVRIVAVQVNLAKIRISPKLFRKPLKTDQAISKWSNKLVAWGDGFNNLTYNIGYWAWGRDGLSGYVNETCGKEALSGPQTAFIKVKGSKFPFIGLILDPNHLDSQIEYAFGAPRIIRPGGGVVSDILSIDSDTGRPLISEICGDIRQVIGIPKRHDFPVITASYKGRRFPLAEYFISLLTQKDKDENIIRRAPNKNSMDILYRAISGDITQIPLKRDEFGIVRDILIDSGDSDRVLSGYEYMNRISSLKVGQFTIKDGKLFIRFKTPHFNHSVLCTVQGRPDILLFVKQIDEGYRSGSVMLPKRNGFSFSESAEVIYDVCKQGLGLNVDQALEMSQGGDPRFCIPARKYYIGSYKSNEEHSPWVSLMAFFEK